MSTTPRFIQVHTLHSYPAALLNRDDSGLAKRITLGGATRTRISSQCLKRHWRDADSKFALANTDGFVDVIRSRRIVERRVMKPLYESGEFSGDLLEKVKDAFNIGIYGEKGKEEDDRQPLLFGLPEVAYLESKAYDVCSRHSESPESAEEIVTGILVTNEDIRKATGSKKTGLRNARKAAQEFFGDEFENFAVFRENTKLSGGLIGALFGRMVTSDPAANIDAAIHVAHAFTVHAEESESDYFSVVEDLKDKDEDAGAAHIGDAELTAGLFYGYAVVDVPGLVSNLEGCGAGEWMDADREMAAKVVEHLLHLIATVSPGAKLGSTAPYAYADLMLVEAGSGQPRSLANAFRKPTQAQVAAASSAMSEHLENLDKAYCAREARRVMSVEGCGMPEAERVNMSSLAAWAADAVRNGEAV